MAIVPHTLLKKQSSKLMKMVKSKIKQIMNELFGIINLVGVMQLLWMDFIGINCI